jgi:hypothetical protein
MALVLFLNGEGGALYLTDIERDEYGRIRRAWVENGCWNLVLKGDEGQAKDGSQIVTRWPVTSYEEVEVYVPYGDYNDIIEAAKKVRHYVVPGFRNIQRP